MRTSNSVHADNRRKHRLGDHPRGTCRDANRNSNDLPTQPANAPSCADLDHRANARTHVDARTHGDARTDLNLSADIYPGTDRRSRNGNGGPDARAGTHTGTNATTHRGANVNAGPRTHTGTSARAHPGADCRT